MQPGNDKPGETYPSSNWPPIHWYNASGKIVPSGSPGAFPFACLEWTLQCLSNSQSTRQHSIDQPLAEDYLSARKEEVFYSAMSEPDEIQEAHRQVQELTESDPINGEELLGSPELRKQLREAKERLRKENESATRKPASE